MSTITKDITIKKFNFIRTLKLFYLKRLKKKHTQKTPETNMTNKIRDLNMILALFHSILLFKTNPC